MKAVHADAELAPRDVVARAVHRQNASGQGAYLDCRDAIGDAFPDRFPAVFAACQRAGIDPRIAPIPVAPTAHYHMGGVMTDIDGRTSISNLWAVGECASSGLHGANRLASNSLAEGLVAAARCAKALNLPPPAGGVTAGQPTVVSALSPGTHTLASCVASQVGQLPPLALTRLRQAMSRHCGVERSETGLRELLALIETLQARYGDADVLLAARFIVTAALTRQESRGGHFRTDYPETAKQASHTRLRLLDLTAEQAARHSNALPAE